MSKGREASDSDPNYYRHKDPKNLGKERPNEYRKEKPDRAYGKSPAKTSSVYAPPEEKDRNIKDADIDYNDREAEEFRKKLAGVEPSAKDRKGDRRTIVESSDNEDKRGSPYKKPGSSSKPKREELN